MLRSLFCRSSKKGDKLAKRNALFHSEVCSRVVPRWKKVTLTFSIEDYEKVSQSLVAGEKVESSVYKVRLQDNKVAKLQIEVLPNGKDKDAKNIVIYLTNPGKFDVKGVSHFSIKDTDGNNWWSAKFPFKVSPRRMTGYTLGSNNNDLLKSGEKVLPGGRLTVVIDLEIYLETTEIGKTDVCIDSGKKMPSLNNNLDLMLDGPFSDIQIQCHDQLFKCHKVVLAARSPVFKAMFEHDSAEMTEGKVIIKDIDSETMKNFMSFIYSDEISAATLQDQSHLLLAAADKYDVPKLKHICEQHMCSTINVDNAAKFAVVSYLHDAKALKRAALKIIVQSREEVRATEDWARVEEHLSELMKELMDAFLAKD